MDQDLLDAVEEKVEQLSRSERRWALPILRSLHALGGAARPRDVEAHVYSLVDEQLNDAQWARVVRGKYIRWARFSLGKIGLVGGPEGTWELTPEGRAYMEAHAGEPVADLGVIEELAPESVADLSGELETVAVTSFSGYELPILEVLGSEPLRKQDLMARLSDKMAPQLLPGDLRLLPAGAPVWHYRGSWAISTLHKNGDVRSAGRAVWEATETGRARLARERSDWSIEHHRDSHAKVRARSQSVSADVIQEETEEASPAPREERWRQFAATVDGDIVDALHRRVRPDLGPSPQLGTGTIPRNVVLYGPPGTGKTFVARRFAQALTGELEPGPEAHWRIVQFHPSYAYEDFVQGMRPDLEHASLRYRLRKGPLLEICEAAEDDPDNFYVLVVDEINRGDPARIFGELLYALEYRGQPVDLAAGGQLSLPENLVIVGTMNSVDRSVALVDYALRRRFGFIRAAPDATVIVAVRGNSPATQIAAAALKHFNDWITQRLDLEHTIGHSFFLNPALSLDAPGALTDVWKLDLEPLILEYFYGEPESVEDARRAWREAVREATRVVMHEDDEAAESATTPEPAAP